MKPLLFDIILIPTNSNGFTVTSTCFPELVTQRNTIKESLLNFCDALQEVIANRIALKIPLT